MIIAVVWAVCVAISAKMVGRDILPTWRAGVIWSKMVHVRIFRPTVLKSPSYEPKNTDKMNFLDTFLKPPLYAFVYYKQDIAHLNAVRTSTHCAKLAKYVAGGCIVALGRRGRKVDPAWRNAQTTTPYILCDCFIFINRLLSKQILYLKQTYS